MIKEESLTALETLAKLEPGSLEVAIKSEEPIEIPVPEGKLFTTTDLETFKTNVIKDNQGDYEDAKKAGLEMGIKQVKQDKGYDFDGKDLNTLLEFHGNTILKDAKIEPDKKIQELSHDKEQLQTNWNTEKENWTREKTAFEKQIADYSINGELLKYFSDTDTLTASDQMTLFKNNHTITKENGDFQFHQNGKALKDETMNWLSTENVIGSFVNDKGWGDVKGREGTFTYKGGTKFENMNDVLAYCEKNKIDISEAEGQKLINDFNAKQ